MRKRSREVNIFNMSLLDILCGALGAFCFLMIALLPYWRPAGQTVEDLRKQFDLAMDHISELQKAFEKMPGNDPNIKDNLERLRSQLKNMESNRQRQEAERKQLEQKANAGDELNSRSVAIISMNQLTVDHDLDLYVRLMDTKGDGKMMPPPNPKEKQALFVGKDTYTVCNGGPCNEIWATFNTAENQITEVYFKFLKANGNPAPAEAIGYLNLPGTFIRFPKVTIPTEQTVVKVGEIRFHGQKPPEFIFDKSIAGDATPPADGKTESKPEEKKP